MVQESGKSHQLRLGEYPHGFKTFHLIAGGDCRISEPSTVVTAYGKHMTGQWSGLLVDIFVES